MAKQVPDTRNVGKDAMTPEGTVNRAALAAIFNPEDLNALEMALEIKERVAGSEVYVLTMGPQRASDIIREAMFRGADGGYLLSGKEFAGSDTLATSYALACALRKINPDIDVSKVVDAFLMAEKYRDSYHAAKKSAFNFEESKDVIVMDSMYSNPARNNMPNTLYFKGSLFKDIDKSVMDFIKSNLKDLTKGMAPIVAVGEQGKEAKGIVFISYFSKSSTALNKPGFTASISTPRSNL